MIERIRDTDYRKILERLLESGVEFIVVGGLAANAHGSPRYTQDVDVVYRRSEENHQRLASALQQQSPYLRGAPADLPFQWDVATINHGLNFTLVTDLGDVDFLGEIAGGGFYDELLPHVEEKILFGLNCQCLSIRKLIEVKRAAGRPKDIEAIAELEAILEESGDASTD